MKWPINSNAHVVFERLSIKNKIKYFINIFIKIPYWNDTVLDTLDEIKFITKVNFTLFVCFFVYFFYYTLAALGRFEQIQI